MYPGFFVFYSLPLGTLSTWVGSSPHVPLKGLEGWVTSVRSTGIIALVNLLQEGPGTPGGFINEGYSCLCGYPSPLITVTASLVPSRCFLCQRTLDSRLSKPVHGLFLQEIQTCFLCVMSEIRLDLHREGSV